MQARPLPAEAPLLVNSLLLAPPPLYHPPFTPILLQQSLLNAVALKEEEKAVVDEDAARGVFLDGKSHLCVLITTDRGLCGSVNSSLTRGLRKELAAGAAADAKVRLFVVGEKGRAQIARDNIPIVASSIDGYSDRDPIFPLAASMASRIVSNSYDVLTLVYNTYENQIKFHNTYKKIPKIAGSLPPSLKTYEVRQLEGELLGESERGPLSRPKERGRSRLEGGVFFSSSSFLLPSSFSFLLDATLCYARVLPS